MELYAECLNLTECPIEGTTLKPNIGVCMRRARATRGAGVAGVCELRPPYIILIVQLQLLAVGSNIVNQGGETLLTFTANT